MDVIYLDNNATTRPAPEVVDAMLPFLREQYGNASSIHRLGQFARRATDIARGQIASLVGCQESELLFTAGGTEAINTAIRSLLASRGPRKKIVTSVVEHSATRELCARLAEDGAQIVEIPVDTLGRLDLAALEAAVDDDTALVTVMWANNETGVIFPISEISAICRARKVPFHCDATQAVGKLPISARESGVDAMSFASHKFHGPKGVGALFYRKGLRLTPLLIGGPQERARRGGTENVPGIVGMGKAAEIAAIHLPEVPKIALMRDRLERSLIDLLDDTVIHGDPTYRLANTSNLGFPRVSADAILIGLAERGLCASAGAACSSGSLEPSHVLKAMHVDRKGAHGAIRFSLSRYTTDEEVDAALDIVPEVINKLRQVMPVG
jgi:cysteine desulfurase